MNVSAAKPRDVLLTVDEWLACETADLPPRQGQVVIGIDLGGSASMTAAAFYWPETGRLEALGTFPSKPSLLDRGQNDGVSGRYVEMQDRGELSTLGDQTVPVAPWLVEVMAPCRGRAGRGDHGGPIQASRTWRGDRPGGHPVPDRLARPRLQGRRRGLRAVPARGL